MVTRIVRCGRIVRTEQYRYYPGHEASIIRLDADRYMVRSTGEIRNYDHADNRSDGKAYMALRRSMRDLRDVINSNVEDPQDIQWVTLTYADNMTCVEQLYEDHRRYWQRYIRYLGGISAPRPEYITAVEPQERGAWHMHTLYFFPRGSRPWVPNDDLARLWGHGYVMIDRLRDDLLGVTNVGAYLTAYLTDVVRDGKSVKGGRLHLYPPRMRYWRASRGIKRPVVEWVSDDDADKIISPAVGSARLTWESVNDRLIDGHHQSIRYRQYIID